LSGNPGRAPLRRIRPAEAAGAAENQTRREIGRLRLQASAQAAVHQERLVRSACIGLLERCHVYGRSASIISLPGLTSNPWDNCRSRRARTRCRQFIPIRSSCRPRRRPIRTETTLLTASSKASTASATAKCGGQRPELQCEINFDRIRSDLHLTVSLCEPKQGDIHGPGTRRHLVELELAVGVGERGEYPVTLGSANRRSGQRLTL